MKYKGYIGIVTYDSEAKIFHGEVVNTKDTITFQGKSVNELENAFKDSINDYLEFCDDLGKSPDKPFSGKFVLRIPEQLHQKLFIRSRLEGESLNSWITNQLNNLV